MSSHLLVGDLIFGGGYLQEITIPKGVKGKVNYDAPGFDFKTTLISVFIFIIVLVCFNLITTIYNNVFDEKIHNGKVIMNNKKILRSLVYCLFVSSLSIFLILIIYFF